MNAIHKQLSPTSRLVIGSESQLSVTGAALGRATMRSEFTTKAASAAAKASLS